MGILLAGGVLGPLTRAVIGGWSGGISGSPLGTLTEVYITGVVAMLITLKGVVTAL